MTATTDVLDLATSWAEAEEANDAGALDGLLAARVRDYGAAAVVAGVPPQETSFRGGDNSGRFRLTLVAVRPAAFLTAEEELGCG